MSAWQGTSMSENGYKHVQLALFRGSVLCYLVAREAVQKGCLWKVREGVGACGVWSDTTIRMHHHRAHCCILRKMGDLATIVVFGSNYVLFLFTSGSWPRGIRMERAMVAVGWPYMGRPRPTFCNIYRLSVFWSPAVSVM